MSKTIYSWNVNGIRAAEKKGLADWIAKSGAYCVALQETKANPSQLTDELKETGDYKSVFHSSTIKKGYSGVAVYYREEPLEVMDLGSTDFDQEGRGQILFYPDFCLLNCYFPNSQSEGARLDYKLDFCHTIMEKCKELTSAGKNIILCGDYNVAHEPIDLAHPESNSKNPGYLPEEREWMTQFLNAGFCDTFRTLHPQEQKYSWWSYRFHARDKNIGWRIDYHCVNKGFMDSVEESEICNDVMGSDHCPIKIKFTKKL